MADFISSPTNIFILGGQSNMAGRGGVSKDPITKQHIWDGCIPPESQSNPSIFRLTADLEWEQASEPLHWDIDVKKTNGIGPGMAFANELLAKGGDGVAAIGLVPCAIGGTHLREWSKGSEGYDTMVRRIKASEKCGGKVQGLLWYQGESDASVEEESKVYEMELAKFFTDLRTDVNHPELPIILVRNSRLLRLSKVSFSFFINFGTCFLKSKLLYPIKKKIKTIIGDIFH